jgi:hypothetical protein
LEEGQEEMLLKKGQRKEKAMKHGTNVNTIHQFWHRERKEVTKNKERKIQITKKKLKNGWEKI